MSFVHQSRKRVVRKRRRKAPDQNTKITDFYQILKRGRENIPKSPQITRSQSLSTSIMDTMHANSPNLSDSLTRTLSFKSGTTEVITISESDDDTDKEGLDVKKTETNSQVSSTDDLHPELKLEQNARCDTPLNNILGTLNDLNVGATADEDIEIVDMLPPIPLRDHPVVDVED